MPESPHSPASARQTPASSLLSHSDNGAEAAANGDSCRGVSGENWQSLFHKQVFLAMMTPQQMQQLLSPNQLQAVIQQKQQAFLFQQQHLKEFYQTQQMELLQHHSNKKTELPAQQLVFQQLLQLQQQHQQLPHALKPALSSPAVPPACLSPADMQQIWKELTFGITKEKIVANSAQKMSTEATRRLSDQQSASPHQADCTGKSHQVAAHTLFGHGVCNWPGCESVCESFTQFLKHMSSEHTLDDRSTAQCRVQTQVVQQLELQLCKERDRLQAMMAHLHLPSLEAEPLQPDAAADPQSPQVGHVQSTRANEPQRLRHEDDSDCCIQMGAIVFPDSRHALSSPTAVCNTLRQMDSAKVSSRPLDAVSSATKSCEKDLQTHILCAGAIRRRQHPLVFSLSSENEYELYKNTDIRPPFTYATLIRQAIMEASDMQLTLNEIYNWFMRTFAYFRRNAATWKNAVRHNLSLHKCFVRVENVKGAVWTVDEEEYQRRRSQKMTGSPIVTKNVCPNLVFGTALHATLQAALEASLSGCRKGSVNRNLRSPLQDSKAADGNSNKTQSISPQVQRQLFIEDEEQNVNEQDVDKPVSLQQNMSRGDGERLTGNDSWLSAEK